MSHIGTWSTRYCMRTAEKVWRSKMKKIWFTECPKNDTRQISSLPSAKTAGTRQINTLLSVRRRHSAKG